MPRIILGSMFGTILVAMIAITVYASLDRGVLNAGSQLVSDRWFQATLADAYFGFLTFYAWVAYKEPSVWARATWFVLIMILGNISMSVYVLIQLRRYDRTRGIESILLRNPKYSVTPA